MKATDWGEWAFKIVVFGLQLAVLFGMGRLLYITGGLRLSNPFQKGWGHLHATYSSSAAVRPMDSGAALIGAITYNGTIEIGFDKTEIVLRKTFFSNQLVRIPYSHITLITAPAEHTIFRIPVRTDGVFEVADVSICFKNKVALQLIDRISSTSR